ncbi:MAG: amidohydrolase family protein, partial [Hyphomicrobiaceae bacterium]
MKSLSLFFSVFVLTSSLAIGATVAQDKPKPQTLFINCNIFDGTSDELAKGGRVLVESNLIKAVGDANLEGAKHAEVIDCAGRTLMPGLIDAHVHLAITEPVAVLRDQQDWMFWGAVAGREAEKMLLRGFTTVRDAGGPAIGLARAIDKGKIPGPRVYPSGPVISQTSGHGEHRHYTQPHPNMPGNKPHFFNQHLEFLADGVPEVLRATREALRLDASQIKVMAGGGVSSSTDPLHTVQYLPEELEAAVKAAKDWDTYVLVHVYTDETILRSIKAGVLSIGHATLMTEKSAKAIKEADVWVVPFFSMLGLDEQTATKALGPLAAP